MLVRQETILQAIGCESARLRDIFKKRGKVHAAWGSLIVTPPQHLKGRDTYMIALPEVPLPGGSRPAPARSPRRPPRGPQGDGQTSPQRGTKKAPARGDRMNAKDEGVQVEKIVDLLAHRDYVGVVESMAALKAKHGQEALERAATALEAERLFKGLERILDEARGRAGGLQDLMLGLDGLANAWHPLGSMIQRFGLDWVNEVLAPMLGDRRRRLAWCAPEFMPFESEGSCPRCGGALQQFPGDTGATSRLDRRTVVCASCGSDEAHAEHYGTPPVMAILPTWAARASRRRRARR